METVHAFRSIRARTVNLIPLYSTGSPLRVCLEGQDVQILPRIIEVSLFKMDHSQTQKRPTAWKAVVPDGALSRSLVCSLLSQFEFRGSNFCADGLCGIASANHATDCIAAASVASFDV
jgi:hypothetical protein